MVSVCLRGGGNAEQIEGAALCAGGGGENGGEAIAPEADDIAGERGQIAKQGVEAVHRERFAIYWVGAFAGGSRVTSVASPCKHRWRFSRASSA